MLTLPFTREFQQFFWSRRLSSPWNLQNLERDWAEAARKKVTNPALEQVYRQSRERLLAKQEEQGKVKGEEEQGNRVVEQVKREEQQVKKVEEQVKSDIEVGPVKNVDGVVAAAA